MARSREATTAWVAEQMRKLQHVTEVEVRGPSSLRVSRERYAPYVAGILSVTEVTPDHVATALAADPETEIVVNIPVESKWTGAAIAVAQDAGIAWGALKDLMSVAGDDNVRGYERDEYRFAGRLLRQFGVVEHVEREADRLWTLHRKRGLRPLRVVALNPYELTADHLRTARDRYGPFDVVFLNNPNGKATAGANEVAEVLEVPILMAGELKARLIEP